MTNQQKKNRRLILIIFGMSFVPFIIAWILSNNPKLFQAKTNNGVLIIPPIVTEKSDLQGADQFSQENMKELSGHWVLVSLVQTSDCNKICQEAIFKSKQLHIMMGKDLTRIRRAVMLPDSISAQQIQQWWKDDPRLLKVRPNLLLLNKITAAVNDSTAGGLLLLMDPLGNIMMQYASDFDPYAVKSDLKKLLSISQIG